MEKKKVIQNIYINFAQLLKIEIKFFSFLYFTHKNKINNNKKIQIAQKA